MFFNCLRVKEQNYLMSLPLNAALSCGPYLRRRILFERPFHVNVVFCWHGLHTKALASFAVCVQTRGFVESLRGIVGPRMYPQRGPKQN